MTTYQLYINLTAPIRLTVGRLGTFDFPAGTYIYTGSAKRNIDSRIERHLRDDKTLRWHIDYLLAHKQATIAKIERHAEPECVVNQLVKGRVIVKHFGASDCRAGCGSHLKHLSTTQQLTQS